MLSSNSINNYCSAGLVDERTGSEVTQVTQILVRLYEVGLKFIKQGQAKTIIFLLRHFCLGFTDDCPHSPSSLVLPAVKHNFSHLSKETEGTLYSGRDIKGRDTRLPPRKLVDLG